MCVCARAYVCAGVFEPMQKKGEHAFNLIQDPAKQITSLDFNFKFKVYFFHVPIYPVSDNKKNSGHMQNS